MNVSIRIFLSQFHQVDQIIEKHSIPYTAFDVELAKR